MKDGDGGLKGRVLSLAGLVDFSDGAIVSKTLLKKEAGNITLFAFDAGQELSEHTSPFDAVVEVLEGEARLTIAGEPLRAAAGELVILPASVPHNVIAEQRFKMLLIMIRSA